MRLLCSSGADLQLTDTWGNTALHHATLGGHFETLKTLLQYKPEVDCRNNEGYLPVHYASLIGRSQNVELILNQEMSGLEGSSNGGLPEIPYGPKTVTWADYQVSKYDYDSDELYDSSD